MQLFDRIINTVELHAILCGTCSENSLSVNFSSELLRNAEIDDDKVLILKPDQFYHSKNMSNPPKAVDCLILIKCATQNHYDLYLVELRDVSTGTKNLKFKDISPKFETIFNRFFDEFQTVFAEIKFGKISLLLITNPFNAVNEDQFKSKFLSTALDAYASKTLSFQNMKFPIQPVFPHKTHIYPC